MFWCYCLYIKQEDSGMQFANNENGLRTYIRDANENARYYCPYCGAPMIVAVKSIFLILPI